MPPPYGFAATPPGAMPPPYGFAATPPGAVPPPYGFAATPPGAVPPPYAMPRTAPAMPGGGYVTPAPPPIVTPPVAPTAMAASPAALGRSRHHRPPRGHKTAWTVAGLVVGGLVFAAVVLKKFELPKRPTDVAVAQVDAGTEPESPPDAAMLVEPIRLDASVVAQVQPGKTTRTQPARHEPVRHEPVRHEPARSEPVKPEPAKLGPVKSEPAKSEPVKGTLTDVDWLTRMPDTKTRSKEPPVPVEPRPTTPGMSGLYSGRIHNLTSNTRTTGRLLLNVSGTSVTGFLTVDPPLVGSGPVVGTVSGNQVTLRVTSAHGTIDLRGVVLGKTLTGGYTVRALAGTQRGSFTLRRP
jgi:hypothetical protein